MTTLRLLAGMASVGVLLHGSGALAQQAQGASSECSGIHCLLNWHLDSAPAQPAPVESRSVGPSPTAAAVVPVKHVKPVRVVTIAAAGPEAARLAGLAAALPKAKMKIVKSNSAEHEAASDFVVATSLDHPSSATGTRLFTEQLHVVAGSKIHALNDLDGKVVSFGPDNGPSQMAARKAFAALNIKVQETPLDLDNALDGLTTGDLDAIVLLAPQPVARLKTVTAPGIHLVSWPEDGTLPEGASATKIEASAYPALIGDAGSIRAMGVQASLVPSSRGARDPQSKTFLKALSENSDALAKHGFDLIKADAGRDRHVAAADH